MVYIILGLVSLVLVWLLLYALARASQAQFQRTIMTTLILLGGVVALYLVFSGRLALAAVLGSSLLAMLVPRWRAYASTHAGAHNQQRNLNMDETEACEILGVARNASKAEIERAYRDLIKKLHPDVGGGDWFAKRLTAARDVLLRKRG